MANAAASLQAQTKQSELQRALAARNAKTGTSVTTQAKEDPFANIKANPIHQVFASVEISPEDKPKAIAKLLANPQSETEARETMKHFVCFIFCANMGTIFIRCGHSLSVNFTDSYSLYKRYY